MMQFLQEANPTSEEGFMARFLTKFSELTSKEKVRLKGASEIIRDLTQCGQDQAAEVQAGPYLQPARSISCRPKMSMLLSLI